MTSLPPEYIERKAAEVKFDSQREALAARCMEYRNQGMILKNIAAILNEEGIKTKTGKLWTLANVSMLMTVPKPPVPRVSIAAINRERKANRTPGVRRQNDLNLTWVIQKYPQLDEWRKLGSEWLRLREAGVGQSVVAINTFIEFLAKTGLPTVPATLLLHRTVVPELYDVMWGKKKSRSTVQTNNHIHSFMEWVLTRPDYTEEDDDGRLQTSPAFRNPISRLSSSGIPQPSESVRPTLPYGYIDELRKMIVEGPNFRDWHWAQRMLGHTVSSKAERLTASQDADLDDKRISSEWFEVDEHLIDHTDPDCVWRARTRTIRAEPGKKGGGRHREKIYEIWSPVRWVALLIKLQLPLRTFQVRMLDSGEADTWKWQDGEWIINQNQLALGEANRPYENGVFLRPNRLVDGNAKVLLHINTNKTADREKAGSAKGYNVPWIVGGPLHQDPFYWMEKLRRWQEKYNPLTRLTRWSELDGRHITTKSEMQLANYRDTAFLFRTPEDKDSPHLPLAITKLDRPWFICLSELESRLAQRNECLPNGGRIRLVPAQENVRSSLRTFFSLHSLRVSLITALALDGQVPLAILQKIAGHSRLIMTLYYTKPGAAQARDVIQAGVKRLNESADDTIIDWLANAEYTQIVRDAIANNPETLRTSIPEQKHLRAPSGWMTMMDGVCLVGGNNVELEAPGCHNGGANIGSTTSPRYTPVVGGARNCPMCRWFITRPYFYPQLAARWNNVSYHCFDAREAVVAAEQRFREIEDCRAIALANDEIFGAQRAYKEAQRALENALQKFEELTQTAAALTRLLERCKNALSQGDGTSLIAVGEIGEFEYAIEEVSSELLQVSGVSEGALLYHDLNAGKAILRQSQLLDAALTRDNLPPVFLTLTENEQQLVGSALLKELALQMNPTDPILGRFQIISLIEARESLTARFGVAVEEALRIATKEGAPLSVASIKSSPRLTKND